MSAGDNLYVGAADVKTLAQEFGNEGVRRVVDRRSGHAKLEFSAGGPADDFIVGRTRLNSDPNREPIPAKGLNRFHCCRATKCRA